MSSQSKHHELGFGEKKSTARKSDLDPDRDPAGTDLEVAGLGHCSHRSFTGGRGSSGPARARRRARAPRTEGSGSWVGEAWRRPARTGARAGGGDAARRRRLLRPPEPEGAAALEAKRRGGARAQEAARGGRAQARRARRRRCGRGPRGARGLDRRRRRTLSGPIRTRPSVAGVDLFFFRRRTGRNLRSERGGVYIGISGARRVQMRCGFRPRDRDRTI